MLDDMETGDSALAAIWQAAQKFDGVCLQHVEAIVLALGNHRFIYIDAARLEFVFAQKFEPLASATTDIEHRPRLSPSPRFPHERKVKTEALLDLLSSSAKPIL